MYDRGTAILTPENTDLTREDVLNFLLSSVDEMGCTTKTLTDIEIWLAELGLDDNTILKIIGDLPSYKPLPGEVV